MAINDKRRHFHPISSRNNIELEADDWRNKTIGPLQGHLMSTSLDNKCIYVYIELSGITSDKSLQLNELNRTRVSDFWNTVRDWGQTTASVCVCVINALHTHTPTDTHTHMATVSSVCSVNSFLPSFPPCLSLDSFISFWAQNLGRNKERGQERGRTSHAMDTPGRRSHNTPSTSPAIPPTWI